MTTTTKEKFKSFLLHKKGFIHFAFWTILLLIYTLSMQENYQSMRQSFVRNIILLIPQLLAAYSLTHVLIPKFLYRKKYMLFAVLFIIGTYIFTALARVLTVHVVEELFREPPFRKESFYEIATNFKRLYTDFFYRVYLPVFLFISIKLVIERFEQINRTERLAKEKAQAELNFLKSQIHPHFLFNTLNNLYALTLQRSDQAPDVVLKLSDMLDYMLYQCNAPKVSIAQEIQLLQNYMDLEKLRYADRLVLSFNKEIDDPNTRVSPLILVSLIENAFKHGASGSTLKPEVKADLLVNKDRLSFTVYNTKPPQKQEGPSDYKKGIGLNNIKSQLNLIYPGRHTLSVKERKTSYTVNLNIELNEYFR